MCDEGKRSVAWSTTVPSGGQGKILLQRYDVSGNTDGNVLTIKASGEVHRPSITYLENNHLALTFFEFNSTTGTRDTHLNIIDDYGFVVHSSVVNEGADAGDYINPEVTDLGNSEFMVQWTFNQNHPQTLATGSYAQLYNYEGTKKGMAFTVSDTNSGSAAINRALKIDNSKFIMPTIKNSNDLAFQIYDKNVQAHVLQGNEFQLIYSNGINQTLTQHHCLTENSFQFGLSGQDGSGNGFCTEI